MPSAAPAPPVKRRTSSRPESVKKAWVTKELSWSPIFLCIRGYWWVRGPGPRALLPQIHSAESVFWRFRARWASNSGQVGVKFGPGGIFGSPPRPHFLQPMAPVTDWAGLMVHIKTHLARSLYYHQSSQDAHGDFRDWRKAKGPTSSPRPSGAEEAWEPGGAERRWKRLPGA